MNGEELQHALKKGLEVWTLQNVCDGAILAGFLVLALVACRAYFEGLKARLTLRVAVEVWETLTDLAVDGLLSGIALVGLFLTNMDILADIKVALPWVPLAFVLMGVALVLRGFHGGRVVGSRAWWVVWGLLCLGCALNWFGFTFVMEGAGEEYLSRHPSAAWEALARMRSDMNPELSMSTFLWAGPAYVLLFCWGVIAGLMGSLRWAGQRGNNSHAGRLSTDGE